jgi:hypothetical protein
MEGGEPGPDRRQQAAPDLGEVSDTEWLARHRDYAQAGIADVWLWHEATWIPTVMFDHSQPGWILDQETDQLGLIYGRPSPAATSPPPDSQQCRDLHWPPCPGDQLHVQ